MVPLAAGFLALDVTALVKGGGGALHWVGTGLVCVFYGLIIWCYLRRGPATATGGSVTAHAAAVVATLSAFAYPLLRTAPPPGAAAQWAGSALVAAGSAWEVWSLRSLGRNVSVIAQARGLADSGPYRWVRHPLYTGEIVSSLGLAILAGSLAAFAVWLGFCFLQVYRACREEQLLTAALPGYRDYRARTAALLPGLF